ncbi:hypothetical protein [Spirosoma rhododendri]|uniref:Uncharacterized protein n=1 Tax=Spirosoma rhododendri TaxID=2728024 RepID=A0A7L5DPB9_9BACT|nr:hypothetical protein [Spirosoma rhododendri]QJD80289.1 hypothetical protein HH216_19075 [Spirosoma rhododendri]
MSTETNQQAKTILLGSVLPVAQNPEMKAHFGKITQRPKGLMAHPLLA